MKIFCSFLLVFVSLFSFSSCMSPTQDYSLKTCGHYAVFGAHASDLKEGSKIKPLEIDEQGRMLYVFSGRLCSAEGNGKWVVVCQKYDTKYVYFYEDICYLPLNTDSIEDLSAEIEHLKIANDWNSPLNIEKMSRRLNKHSFDGWIISASLLDYYKVRDSIISNLEIAEDDLVGCHFEDENIISEQEMFLVKVVDETLTPKTYLAIVNKDYSVNFLSLDNNDISSLTLKEFKTQSGWEYGY